MPDDIGITANERESLFLNEYLMIAASVVVVVTSLITLCFSLAHEDTFEAFQQATKLVAAAAMYLAFRSYKWDVAKGLMGGVLFALMYQEGYFALVQLWGEQDFDTYLMVGVQGSLYLAAAGMTFLMTVIITINHFFINYSTHGSPKNVTLSVIAIIFKLATYILLFVTNAMLGFATDVLWMNALRYVTDIALILLLICVETQFDYFNVIKSEFRKSRAEERKSE